jgi:hypothetical protein
MYGPFLPGRFTAGERSTQATFGELNRTVIEPRGVIRIRPSHGCLLPDDAEEQQCLVVLLHAVPFDFTHDQLP